MPSSRTPPTPPSLLLRLGQPGHSEAWPRFVRLYTPVLLAWARRLGLDGEDAADLVQDVFVRLLQVMPSFTYDPSRRFRGWLWTVFLNQHRARLRSRSPIEVRLLPDADAAGPDEVADWVEQEYRRHVVSQAVRLMRGDFAETTWRACWELVVEGRPPRLPESWG